jgi:DNA-binding transcriptional regulator YhcF (GntR family)
MPNRMEEEALERLSRELRLQIGRGVYRPGDELPFPYELAKQKLVNPRRLDTVFKKLTEDGIAVDYGEERYMVSNEAPALCAAWLREMASDRIMHILDSLEQGGSSRTEITELMEAVLKQWKEDE